MTAGAPSSLDAAMIGLGRWGKNIVNAVQGRSERIRFVTGMVRNPEPVREFCAAQGLQLMTDYAAVLADPRVQAVVLTTPHSLHLEQVLAAAAAGKHVLCEKPLALTGEDAARAVSACAQAGVVLGVGHDKRFWPSMRELKRVVASGLLGEILHIEGHFSNEVARQHLSPWRLAPGESPAGSMTATGIHILDAFVNLLGPARRISARTLVRQTSPERLDTLSVLLEFHNRATGVLCSVRSTPLFWRVHVFGTAGSAEAVDQTELVIRMSGEKPQRTSLEPVDAVRASLEAFADAIAGRAPYPISSTQMVATVAALEAIDQSLSTEAAVVLGAST